mmetsp:Transcript_15920/g.21053  ORF Transcript_15920/g.21053 Transcript_15920/m.21053 type:complete len:418 (+) Transcript_15920:172-1425(+)|eukprot:CAMPEP_0117740708 /NCGR_PEP_ID=MMETSP0947-20121206/4498_1 /TAXON_ID=44440 /ORGANISM="Chattonella subsalsa, Strain CCMP2191" /LENGTH=417 /DNA_ID=CAMNT_0005556865 /DNA_START=170 /DNA_END=1423 /DNA_ORIENTATION=+
MEQKEQKVTRLIILLIVFYLSKTESLSIPLKARHQFRINSPVSNLKASYFVLDEIIDGEAHEAKIARERVARKYASEKVFDLEVVEKFDLQKLEEWQTEQEKAQKIDLSWSSIWYKLATIVGFWNIFPLAQELLRFIFEAQNDALTYALTGALVPTLSVLLGTLTSFTISTLLAFQNKIKIGVNRETSAVIKLTKKIIALHENDYESKSECLGYVWTHIKTLAVRSRIYEMYSMLYEDPLQKITDNLNTLPDERGLLLERAYEQLDCVISARNERLTLEGEGVPYVQLNLLVSLSAVTILVFLVLCANESIYNDLASDRDIRIFFTLLVGGCTVTYEFIKDLNRPFLGKLNIGKRALTSVNILQIKNTILREMGADWLELANMKFALKEAEVQNATKKNSKQLIDSLQKKQGGTSKP